MDVDVTELLPEDVLADVLRRLAPRWLAASRCVCRCWRATVDSHGLLRAILPLLPRSVAGIFMTNSSSWRSFFLCRPSTGPAFSADLHYTFSAGEGRDIRYAFEVRGHCNGLVLLPDRVVNPATRQWTRLAPRPRSRWCTGLDLDDDCLYDRVFCDEMYLVFDPTMSPHFEVYSIPRVEWQRPGHKLEWPAAVEELEWPPSPCILQVYSSETGKWEERSFVREGPAAGTVADMRADTFTGHRYAVHWRGTLYVQCQTDFIMRLTLSSRKYKLIQAPVAFEPAKYGPYDQIYGRRLLSIGKSEKGVYSVLIDERFQMKVWILDDSNNGQKIEWVPKQLDRQLIKLQRRSLYQHQSPGRWRLQPITSYGDPEHVDMVQEKFEWDSDNENDDVLLDGGSRTGYQYHIAFLGFHPYKEVIFLNDSFERVLAYHLNSSKIQYLGYVYPEDQRDDFFNEEPLVHASFPYTPCWMGHDGWEREKIVSLQID